MKTRLKNLSFLLLSLGLALSMQAQAGNKNSFYTISGVVKNKENNRKMEYVSVSVPGTGIGTVTNEDGEFTLKINDSIRTTAIELSCVGFYNNRIPVSGMDMINQTFIMVPKYKELQDVVVMGWDPHKLVEKAAQKIPENYSTTPNLLTGFYRETVQKRKNYVNISEAVIQIYKTSYTEDLNRDRVQIIKGRKLLSPKTNDTLAVKLLGGPNLSLFIDIVKNKDIMLDEETMHYFNYTMDEMVFVDGQLNYVVKFEPQMILPYALYHGKLFIDKETLAFTRAEFNLDMRDKNKVTEMILKKKPAGLKFRPEEVSFIVSYKQRNGITYLNYVRNEVKFKCDWQRRLFATNYTVLTEMVVTDNLIEGVTGISRKDAFSIHHSLSDQVMNFYDKDFWGAYNIIEPTESLESAVNKLKKEYK